MYVGCSGNSRVCTWVAVGTIAYVCRFQEGHSSTSVHVLFSTSNFVHIDVNTSTGDVSKSYMWSATDL
jgi:hypothetical protein